MAMEGLWTSNAIVLERIARVLNEEISNASEAIYKKFPDNLVAK